MRRREFLETIATGLVVAGAGARLAAQGNPKIYLFGLTVVRERNGIVGASLPAVSSHGAFLAGDDALVRRLANGNPVRSAVGTGVDEGHSGLGKAGTSLVCLKDHAVQAGTGTGQFQSGLGTHVPNVPNIAAIVQQGPNYAFSYPPGTITLSLGGGSLRMPGTKSHNLGTHDVAWQFTHNGTGVGSNYTLTDLLVFEAAGPSMDIVIGPARATLGVNQELWFVNIPTFMMPDTSINRIEHASDWFMLLNTPIQGMEARTQAGFSRRAGKTALQHPCAVPGAPVRLQKSGARVAYFPPDTDPCFIVME